MATTELRTRIERPAGIWFLALANALFVLPYPVIIAAAFLYYGTADPDGYHPGWPAIRSGLFLLCACVAACSIGALLGNRQARNTLIATLTVYQLFPLVLVLENLTTRTAWFWLLFLSVHAVWLIVNYWYFLGQPTRQFFASRGADLATPQR